jgi:hypothetical protein
MNYLGEEDVSQVMGIGYLGEVRAGPDGNLYQWVQGVDGLGNPVGFWKALRRIGRHLRPFIRQALPLAQRFAPMIPGVGPAVSTALRVATPFLRQAGVAGNGFGELYQAPDGTVYEFQGLGAEEDFQGFGQEELMQVMGVGQLGELRQGPDGNFYQWVQGVDGLGNPFGFWKKLKRLARKARPFLQKALPIAQKIAPFIPVYGPAIAAGLKVATPILKQTGIVGTEGLGELYEGPDGAVYEMQGVGQEEDLTGLAQEELEGFAQDEPVEGFGQGYVRDENTSGFEAFVPEVPAETRWYRAPIQPPELFRPIW